MRRCAFAAVLAVAAVASDAGRAGAQAFNSYAPYFPAGGRAFPGATGYSGFYEDTPYPNDLFRPWRGFTFGRVPPTPAVPPPPTVYFPREGDLPTGRRWAPAHYWRKD